MKKLLLGALMLFAMVSNAQKESNSTQTSKGNFVIEANTGAATIGNTNFSFSMIDGNSTWSVGLDGGYFIKDNLAIKAGLGYSDAALNSFNYKVGTEYYINGNIPVGIDFTGTSMSDLSTNWLGLQGGYAYFIGDHISIKPTLRYNVGLEEGQKGLFQGLIGFALYL